MESEAEIEKYVKALREQHTTSFKDSPIFRHATHLVHVPFNAREILPREKCTAGVPDFKKIVGAMRVVRGLSTKSAEPAPKKEVQSTTSSAINSPSKATVSNPFAAAIAKKRKSEASEENGKEVKKEEKPKKSNPFSAAVAAASLDKKEEAKLAARLEEKLAAKEGKDVAKVREERKLERKLARADANADDDEDELDMSTSDMDDKKKARKLAAKFVKSAARDVDKERGKHDTDSEDDALLGALEKEDEFGHLKDATVYDHETDEKTYKKYDEQTKEIEAERKRAELKEFKRALKHSEERFAEMANGYETEEDEDEEKKKAEASAASVQKVKTSAASVVADMDVDDDDIKALLEKKRKKKPAPAAAAAAAAVAAEPKAEVELKGEMQPKLYYERCFDEKVVHELKKMQEGVLNELREPFADVFDEKKAQALLDIMLCKVVMNLEAVVNARDYAILEESAQTVHSILGKDYSGPNLVAASTRHSTWWKYDERMRVRQIDFAYTLHMIEKEDELLDAEFREIMYSCLLAVILESEIYTQCVRAFRVQESDIEALKKDGVDEWICAVTGDQIVVGDVVNCLAGAVAPVIDAEERHKWLEKAVNYGAFKADGLTSMSKFKRSEYNKHEYLNAPVVAFYKCSQKERDAFEVHEAKLAERKKKEDEAKKMHQTSLDGWGNQAKHSSEEQQPEHSAAAENGDVSPSKKRKAEENGGDEEESESKRMKGVDGRTKLPFKVTPTWPLPKDSNYTQASMDEPNIQYKLIPCSAAREFIASRPSDVRRVQPGMRFMFTDNNVELLTNVKHWVYCSAQFGFVTDNVKMEESSSAEAMEMFNTLKDRQTYDEAVPNTASMLLKKLDSMRVKLFAGPNCRRPTHVLDKKVFGEWLKFIFASFSHPAEDQCLDDKHKMGRLDKLDVPLQCETKLKPDELPFGRQLTPNEFFTQFMRIAMDALYENIVKPLSLRLLEEYAKSEDVNVDVDLSGEALFTALYERAQAEASYSNEEVRQRIVKSEKEWKGKLTQSRSADKKFLTAAWKIVRKALLAWKMDEDVAHLRESKIFVNAMFPLQY